MMGPMHGAGWGVAWGAKRLPVPLWAGVNSEANCRGFGTVKGVCAAKGSWLQLAGLAVGPFGAVPPPK